MEEIILKIIGTVCLVSTTMFVILIVVLGLKEMWR